MAAIQISLVVEKELMVTRAWFYLLGSLLFVCTTQVWCSIEETLGRDFIPECTPRHEPMPRIERAKLSGTYDHRGTRVTLNSDGGYVALWHDTHCGNGGQGKVEGKWHVSARTLVLSPTSETGMTEPIPRELNIFEWGGSDVVLVPRGTRFLNLTGLSRSECFLRLVRLRALRERAK
jgi:hypothetical protein